MGARPPDLLMVILPSSRQAEAETFDKLVITTGAILVSTSERLEMQPFASFTRAV
jgi:hypothetical protein